jgi:hypothetical protein
MIIVYSNPYNNQAYIQELQNMKDRIDRQLQQVTQPQTPNIHQTFQITPTQSQATMRYANTIDDVNKELVFSDTPFFTKDLSVMWLKNVKGEVKAYELKEIIQKDEKDLMIENLQLQINELKKGMIDDAKSPSDDVDEPTTKSKSSDVSTNKSSKTK